MWRTDGKSLGVSETDTDGGIVGSSELLVMGDSSQIAPPAQKL